MTWNTKRKVISDSY